MDDIEDAVIVCEFCHEPAKFLVMWEVEMPQITGDPDVFLLTSIEVCPSHGVMIANTRSSIDQLMEENGMVDGIS